MDNTTDAAPTLMNRVLNKVEVVGNKLPDPAILFLYALLIVWALSWLLSGVDFGAVHPKTGAPLEVANLLTGTEVARFLSEMVTTFTSFAPLGVVLVAMLGVGVADESKFINTGLKLMLRRTPTALLTPMVILIGLLSHSAIDAGYVLVIPLGGIIFYAAGRHPLAGIAAAFAGVSGGFSANPAPSALDPMLQGFTQPAARILDPSVEVNPLGNYFFTAVSSVLVIALGWFLTDKVIEPRLQKNAKLNDDIEPAEDLSTVAPQDKKAFTAAALTMLAGLALLALAMFPEDSPLRDAEGKINSFDAPIMQSIVPLILLLFLIPGVVYGRIAGTFKSGKDVIDAMSKSMSSMGYYIVMAFFCSLFIKAFGDSNIGAILAVKGAEALRGLAEYGGIVMFGIILLVGFVNIFVGSASAKWALLAPILVPMLMQLGFSPELTQAAYRVGDSSTNIITPLMPYFPLVVVYCQRYVKQTGIGNLVSMMLPYSLVFLVCWSLFLLAYWGLGIPLGFGASYTYP